MSVKHHIDSINRLIISDWEGDADADQFIGAYVKYQKKILNDPEFSTFDEVFNIKNIKTLKLNFHDLKNISNITASHDTKKSTKVAFIVGTRFVYVLAKAYVIVRRLNPNSRKRLGVFFNEFDALKWINSKA